MMRKRSFSVVINLETKDEDVDLAEVENDVYYRLAQELEDPAFSEHIAYVSREDGSSEWTEPDDE